MTLDDAAKLQPASVDAVVVGDLNFTDYPVLPAADAVRTLMAKLNISASDDPWVRRGAYSIGRSRPRALPWCCSAR